MAEPEASATPDLRERGRSPSFSDEEGGLYHCGPCRRRAGGSSPTCHHRSFLSPRKPSASPPVVGAPFADRTLRSTPESGFASSLAHAVPQNQPLFRVIAQQRMTDRL
jgi:hypothetical protein